VGAAIAAPIMFDVFSQVAAGDDKIWFEPSYEVGTRSVCAVSGQPAGRFCREQVAEKFLIGKSPTAICSVHRPIFVDRQSGLRLRANCTIYNDFETKIIEQWPQPVASWLVANGKSSPLPQYDPNCLAVDDGLNPTIISPEPGAVFEIVDDISPEYQKISLQASIASGDGLVHWFLDGKHLWAVRAGKTTFYFPKKGRHTLLCIDDAGRSATVNFTVN
jgi:penicillin-binding protein 1C